MRIGQGFDAHAFQDGGQLVLGGVHIDHPQSLAAHSDGDVVIHALCDALLGGAGLRDIGQHFPDSDPRYKRIDSRELLRNVVRLLQARNLGIGNLDLTIIAQAPKLAPYIPDMTANLASDCGIDAGRVNIKATTTEKMGFTGRSEGIAAMAVALLLEQGE
jgi:2-C-methyl-D-erythritol 2,4-cyclodiphosphate synthase